MKIKEGGIDAPHEKSEFINLYTLTHSVICATINYL